jgi:hypothetical protein
VSNAKKLHPTAEGVARVAFTDIVQSVQGAMSPQAQRRIRAD